MAIVVNDYMDENVFILGAGASVESGAPLMNNFIDVAEDLFREGAVNDVSEDFERVFTIIDELQTVYSKSFIDLNNIESLFGAIEMAGIINKLGNHTKEEIAKIRNSLIVLISRTLEKKVRFPVTNKSVISTLSYQKLINLLKDKKMTSSSIITFNYDIALDFALYVNSYDPNYCLDNKIKQNIKLLKLHGSLNWFKCEKTDEIFPYTMSKFFTKYPFNIGDDDDDDGDKSKYISICTKHLDIQKQHLGKSIENVPVIVPPTWNKTEYQGTLTNVWNATAEQLCKARNIYVFGYSLPESDSFFRYLFALGTMGKSRIRRFWVFDPSKAVEERYQRLIGKGISNRFQYFECKFSDAIDELRKQIGL